MENKKNIPADIICMFTICISTAILIIFMFNTNNKIHDLECTIGLDDDCDGYLNIIQPDWYLQANNIGWHEECFEYKTIEKHEVVETSDELRDICSYKTFNKPVNTDDVVKEYLNNQDINVSCVDENDKIKCYEDSCINQNIPMLHIYNHTFCSKKILVREE